MRKEKQSQLKCLLSNRPKRKQQSEMSKDKHSQNILPPCDMVCMIKDNKNKNQKYFDDDQVKSIWDLANSLLEEQNVVPKAEEEEEKFDDSMDLFHLGGDSDQGSVHGAVLTESMHEGEGDQVQLEWEHMYPVRKSLYNRKSHFLSFIQNYAGYDMGRKIMSEYESTMCDFILMNMKPSKAEEFLEMLKECKLSNVYRFYDHLFHCFNYNKRPKEHFEIEPNSIDSILHIFNMFQAYFHRNSKFSRKNFLSMRFLLGRILVYLGYLPNIDSLPLDLRRPKGKSQLLFHEQVWQNFLLEL